MDESEINSKINYVNNFRNNLIRSMNIRIKISQDRIRAIRLLEQYHQDQNGLQLLEKCIKNERWFLRIVEKGLRDSFEQLKSIYDWINTNINDKEAKNRTRRLIEIIEIYYSKIKDIEHRLNLEEAFIKKQNEESFRQFVNQWNREIKLNRKLLKKTVDSSDLEEYFKKIKIIITSALKAGVIGGALGAFIRKFFFLPEFKNTITGQPLSENKQILVSAALFALMAVVASTMVVLDNIEKQVEEMNVEELGRARRSI